VDLFGKKVKQRSHRFTLQERKKSIVGLILRGGIGLLERIWGVCKEGKVEARPYKGRTLGGGRCGTGGRGHWG